MARPVRTKRVPKRFEDAAKVETPVVEEIKKIVRKGEAKVGRNSKKNLSSESESDKKRSSALKDKTNADERKKKKEEPPKEVETQSRRLRNRTKSERNENEEIKDEVKELKSNIKGRGERKKESKRDEETTRTGNKFFKTKKPLQITTHSQIAKTNKIRDKKTEKNDSVGFVASLRQTTLSESFRRGASARLRPRKVARDYKDASLLEKSVSPDKRKSLVLLERIEPTVKKPVYKITIDDPKDEDKDSVYDFRFDSNDPTEKPKKKKRVRRAAPRKKKPISIPKPKPQEADKKETQIEKVVSVDVKDVQKEDPAEIAAVNHPVVADEPEKGENSPPIGENSPPIGGNSPPIGENSPPKDDKTKERSPRLRICAVERLTGDRKVSFKPNPSTSRQTSATFNPFRSTQSIFRPRPTLDLKEMIDHSLLNKSLSPIRGEQKDSFDAASPWRPPAPESFFKVRQVVQSTPQIKRNFGRPSSPQRGLAIDENVENQENVSPQKKFGIVRSPLGVRSSNAENIQASNQPKILGSSNADNKQNSNPGFADRLYKSPKKSDKITQKRNVLCAINEAPLSPLQKTDENISSMEESRLMKQSNLNSFLNIDEMPESIKISTSHGIFGDAHSTPVVRAKVIQPEQSNVDNFFGFEDDENSSDTQVSPIKEKQRATPVKKIFDRLKGRVFSPKEKNTARISLGEIKNTLYPRKEKKPDKKNSGKKEEAKKLAKIEEEVKSCNNNKTTEDAVQFSDTFDVMPEIGGGNEAESSTGAEIALFADIEPVHFTQPPRWSYSKKRDRKRYWSDDENDDNDVFEGRKAPVLKKRRVARVNKIEEKKIEDWVKSVNETFQEIDDFDLVVEKLP